MLWSFFIFLYAAFGSGWLFYIGHIIRKRERSLARREVMKEFLAQQAGKEAKGFTYWYERQWDEEDRNGGLELDMMRYDLHQIHERVGVLLFCLIIFMAGVFWLPLTIILWYAREMDT